MRLAIDIGNSRIKLALIQQGDVKRTAHLATTGARRDDLMNAVVGLTGDESVDRVGIASVVPHLTDLAVRAVSSLADSEPLLVQPNIRLPFTIAYESPQSLGSDRVAAAAAAWVHYGRPSEMAAISIDTGTATTFEVVTRDGVFIGGAIAPGPKAMSRALHSTTTQLPEVEVDVGVPAIGTSTRKAIQAGVTFSYLDGVLGILRRITAALGEPAIVVVTGGWSDLLSPHMDRSHEVDPNLVLRGIDVLMELNV